MGHGDQNLNLPDDHNFAPIPKRVQELMALIEANNWEAAQHKVVELRAVYSQDYTLALQHGWIATQQGNHDEAAAASCEGLGDAEPGLFSFEE